MASQSDDAIKLQEKIVKQLEYYFGDFNLMRDKFMNEQMGKDDGWISLTVLLTFNRLKALASDPGVIVDAVIAKNSELLEVSEDKLKIRRSPKHPLPERNEYRDQVMQRTLHIKGFPLDSTFESLWTYCSNYGTLESLQLRRTKVESLFKGCVLAVYRNKEDADKILGQRLLYGEKELLKEKEEEHVLRRKEFFRNRKQKGKVGENKPVKDQDENENDPNIKSKDEPVTMKDETVEDNKVKPSAEEHGLKREAEDTLSEVCKKSKVEVDESASIDNNEKVSA